MEISERRDSSVPATLPDQLISRLFEDKSVGSFHGNRHCLEHKGFEAFFFLSGNVTKDFLFCIFELMTPLFSLVFILQNCLHINYNNTLHLHSIF